MHRIDGHGATADSRFTEGEADKDIPVTTVTGDWLNAVREEIVGVIVVAGIALSKGDNGQLAAAIKALIAQAQGVSTGDIKSTLKAAADPGWVLCSAGTIGKPGTAATARANDDCRALFAVLWSDAAKTAPVSGRRGASAAADWKAGKVIDLRKLAATGGAAGNLVVKL
ncbi:MAG: hypothetical protein ACRC6L_09950 [Steroidobacteraceae bacterium]